MQCDLACNDIDVALIVETWFRPSISDDVVAIDNYVLYRRDRCNRKGGGIAAYVRCGIDCKIFIPPTATSKGVLEYIWLEMVFHSQSVFILCCYHPPKPQYVPSQLQVAIANDFEYLLTHRKDAVFVIAGDFNSFDTCFLERDFGLQQMVTTVTHGSKIIDKVFVSHPELFTCDTIKSIVKTKHLAVILHSATRSLLTPRGTFRRRVIVYDLKLHNIIRLRHAINDFDWNDLLSSSQDVSAVYSLFISSIRQLINHCVPAKTVKISPRDPSYITPVIKAMLNKRRKLRRSGRTDEANILAEKINEMICKGRERCLSSISNSTSKELWAAVNGKSQRNGNIAINGVPLNSNALNCYFATVATDPDYDEQKVMSYRVNLCDNDTYDNSVVHDYEIEPMLRHISWWRES